MSLLSRMLTRAEKPLRARKTTNPNDLNAALHVPIRTGRGTIMDLEKPYIIRTQSRVMPDSGVAKSILAAIVISAAAAIASIQTGIGIDVEFTKGNSSDLSISIGDESNQKISLNSVVQDQVIEQAQEEIKDPVYDADFRHIDDTKRKRLIQWVNGKWKTGVVMAHNTVDMAIRAGEQSNVDPTLVLAVIAKESSFRPHVVSGVGAEGLMQVWRKWHKTKFAEAGIQSKEAATPQQNILIGTSILREYLAMENMNTAKALQRYNGARHDGNMEYAKKVFAFRKEITSAISYDTFQPDKVTSAQSKYN